MSAERKKSWVEMTDRNSEFFTWADIVEMTAGGNRIVLQVVAAKQGEVKQAGKKGKRGVALSLADADGKVYPRPLLLNPTNAKAMTANMGTDKPADWEARQPCIGLFIGRANDPKNPGTECNCVRISKGLADASDLHGAKYNKGAALSKIAAAQTADELTEVRAKIGSQRPPAADHAELKTAVAAAEKRIAELVAAAAAIAAEQSVIAEAGSTPEVTL